MLVKICERYRIQINEICLGRARGYYAPRKLCVEELLLLHWTKPEPGTLFDFCRPVHVRGNDYGCLVQVRCGFKPAYTEAFTTRIRRDKAIATNLGSVVPRILLRAAYPLPPEKQALLRRVLLPYAQYQSEFRHAWQDVVAKDIKLVTVTNDGLWSEVCSRV